MKLNWILGSGVVSIAAVVVACGSSSGSGGAGGAGTGATTTTATGSSTHAATTGKGVTATTGSAAGGAGGSGPYITPVCTGIPTSPPSNGTCFTVMTTTGATTSSSSSTTTSSTASTGTGMGNVFCNPIKDTECNVAGGETCDITGGQFICFGPPNDADLCTACDNKNGPFCKDGMHCSPTDAAGNTTCVHYCCNDGDCGTGGTCDKTIFGDPDVGLCGTPHM